MKKIILRFKSLIQQKLLFMSLISLTILTYSLLPIISGVINKNTNYMTYNNVDNGTIFIDYNNFKKYNLDRELNKDDYSIVTKSSLYVDNSYYYLYISDEKIINYYLYFNKLYLNINNKNVTNNYFYSNDLSIKSIEFNGKTYNNSYEKLDISLPILNNEIKKESEKIILIIDNNFKDQEFSNFNRVYISPNINNLAKENLFNHGAFDGKTLKDGTKEQTQNITNLMSILLLAPFILIIIISYFIIDNLYEQNKKEDSIKLLYYQKKYYYKVDNLIDYFIVYFIPMLIGISISLVAAKILNLGVHILFYLFTQIFSILLLFLFIFRKRKIGKIL